MAASFMLSGVIGRPNKISPVMGMKVVAACMPAERADTKPSGIPGSFRRTSYQIEDVRQKLPRKQGGDL
eukprot:1143894-Pelagomonas_calceolata.AAC.4